MKIQGQVAVVTGGASGLGLATVEHLVRAGGRVVLVDLPGSAGQQVAELLPDVTFAPADVTDVEQMRDAFAVANELGPFRSVVHAAGVSRPVAIDNDHPQQALDEFRKIVDINLAGCFNAIQLAVPLMAAQEPEDGDRGVIVTTGSVAAYEGIHPAYSASKGGVVSLTLPAAREVATRRIRIVCIAPGLFETPMLSDALGPEGGELFAQVPHPKRLGKPAEFASLAAHVIENPMINGETIRIDGGLRLSI